MFYREWCLKPNQRRGCMLPLPMIAKFEQAPDAGYASVYMFDEAAAQTIKAQGSSVGFARFPVYADNLTLDLDKGEEQLAAVVRKIDGFSYKVYASGGKGFHIIIPLTEMVCGKNVPYSQRRWAEALNAEVDLSLYQAGHIISLPGRKHPKTGQQKRLISVVPGETLSLSLVEATQPTFTIAADPNQSELEKGIWRLLALLQSEPGVGNRHVALWATARHLADAGLEFDTALNLLTEVNNTWDAPKSEEEVRIAVQKAFKNIKGL